MSNIKGVFFPYQVIPAKALGAFAAKTVTDGVLEGCDVTYAGTVLTIGGGYLIACGRIMEISGEVTLSLAGAASGYARVSILVDTTKTSTKENFEQADFYVEYSTTVDGFSDAYAENVNLDGTLYQMQLCVVALSAAGITGIVEEPPQALGRGEGMKTLWENASPESSFAAQKISVPGLAACNFIKILFWVSDGSGRQKTVCCYVPTTDAATTSVEDTGSAWELYKRVFTIDRANETIEFAAGRYTASSGSSTNASIMVPWTVLGGSIGQASGASEGGTGSAGKDGSDGVGITSITIEEV